MEYDGRGAVISFPSAVQVVEGRDEFKIDGNYDSCVAAAFKAFEKYLREDQKYKNEVDKWDSSEMADFIPAMAAALEVKDAKKIPNLKTICGFLFPGCEYVLPSRHRDIKNMVSRNTQEKYFLCSMSAYSFWKDIYKTEEQFIEDYAKPLQSLFPEESFNYSWFVNNNLNYLLYTLGHCPGLMLSPVKTEPGESPLYYDSLRTRLYVNLDHPIVEGEYDACKVYSLMAEFLELPKSPLWHHDHIGYSLKQENYTDLKLQQSIGEIVASASSNHSYLNRMYRAPFFHRPAKKKRPRVI